MGRDELSIHDGNDNFDHLNGQEDIMYEEWKTKFLRMQQCKGAAFSKYQTALELIDELRDLYEAKEK